MKLSICAGDRRTTGFIHHDVLPISGVDIVCDFYGLESRIDDESCTDVLFTHALEHFPTTETEKVLALIFRKMKDGAKLYIEVPNFKWHAQILLEGRDEDAVYYAFGGQKDEFDFHKTGFTKKIITEKLQKVGFTDIDVKDNSSLEVTCYKHVR